MDSIITNLSLLNVGLSVLNANWNYQNVNSPFARIYLVTEGEARIHLPDNKVSTLTPGHLYLVPPFTLHSYQCDTLYVSYYIHIFENTTPDSALFEDYDYPVEVDANPIDFELVKRLVAINPNRQLHNYDPFLYDNSAALTRGIVENRRNPIDVTMETKGIIYQLLSRFLAHSTNRHSLSDERIKGVLHYIRKNINNPISVDQMAKNSCLSKDHFIKLFKREIGTTPNQYVICRKMERAQRLLAMTNKSITEIAYSLSYDNLGYFNRLFNKQSGMSPSAYRRQLIL